MAHHHQPAATLRISSGNRHYQIGILRNLEGQKCIHLTQNTPSLEGDPEGQKVEIAAEDLPRILEALQVAMQLGPAPTREVMKN